MTRTQPRRAAQLVLTLFLTAASLAACGGSDPPRTVARGSAEPASESSSASQHPGQPAVEAGLTAPIAAAARAGGVLVDVAGHVRRPGVYRLAAGSRVHEAIAAAGGVRRGADLAVINRAAPLVDGQQVLIGIVAVQGSGIANGSTAATGSAPAGGSRQISINAADAAALDALPGIGPITAERIVADRNANGPFASVDDLDRVPGIGPATVEALREVARA